jgi:hypothetical protein
MGEFVPGYEASFIFGIGAPKDTPADNFCLWQQALPRCRPSR